MFHKMFEMKDLYLRIRIFSLMKILFIANVALECLDRVVRNRCV